MSYITRLRRRFTALAMVVTGTIAGGSAAIAQRVSLPATGSAAASTKPAEPPQDWANLGRYRAENATLAPVTAGEKRVVFFGDSITDGWGRWPGTGSFFPGKPYVNRGISGQTTPQMLVRFQQDVVQLHPGVVVILAGTNDIAGNTGPSTPEMIEDNLDAMVAVAHAHGIQVVLASITPVHVYPWKPTIFPTDEIRALNHWMASYCSAHQCVYLDYFSAMADPDGGMRAGLSRDGVHPVEQGYALMTPLAEQAITQAEAMQP